MAIWKVEATVTELPRRRTMPEGITWIGMLAHNRALFEVPGDVHRITAADRAGYVPEVVDTEPITVYYAHKPAESESYVNGGPAGNLIRV